LVRVGNFLFLRSSRQCVFERFSRNFFRRKHHRVRSLKENLPCEFFHESLLDVSVYPPGACPSARIYWHACLGFQFFRASAWDSRCEGEPWKSLRYVCSNPDVRQNDHTKGANDDYARRQRAWHCRFFNIHLHSSVLSTST